MIKKAYSVQMTYDVSDQEKNQANKAILFFDHAKKLLQMASEHLDIMKTPFKDSPDMPPEEVMKARAAIRRFRDNLLIISILLSKQLFSVSMLCSHLPLTHKQ